MLLLCKTAPRDWRWQGYVCQAETELLSATLVCMKGQAPGRGQSVRFLERCRPGVAVVASNAWLHTVGGKGCLGQEVGWWKGPHSGFLWQGMRVCS